MRESPNAVAHHADEKRAFVAHLARTGGQRLRRFLGKKLRNAEQDIPDLIQEVYLRLMRVQRTETIRSPEAYLFTVAFHVIYQHRLKLAEVPDSVDVMDALGDSEFYAEADPSGLLDSRRRLAEVDIALRQLPTHMQVTFILSRRDGYTLEEIAQQLKISRGACKKYLAIALAHVRRHCDKMESDS